jgi:MFS family permease
MVAFATFGYFLSIGSLAPTLPLYIYGPLGAGSVGVGIGVGAFTVTALLLRPFSGRLGDRRGRRIPIVGGLAIHTASLMLLLVVGSLPLLVMARLVTGVGEALFFVNASASIQDLAPDDRRAEAASLFSLSLFGGLALGPLVGEGLLQQFGFDAVWIFASAAAGAGWLITLTVRDTRTHTELSTSSSLVHRAALKPGVILFCAVWGLAAFSAFIALYAREVGLSESRFVFLTNSVVILLMRSLGARIPDRVGHLRAARFSLTCTPLALLLMGVWASPPALFIGAGLLGLGQSMAFPSLMSMAVNNAAPNERGAVMGTFTAFFDIAFGGGTLALGGVAAVAGLQGTYLVAMAVAATGFIVLLISPPRHRLPKRDVHPVIEIEPPGE